MSTLKELRDVRLEKLSKLKSLGVDPYPARSNKSVENAKITADFDKLQGKEIVAAGRIVSIRTHGKIAFVDLKDDTGKIQLYIKEENLQNANYVKSELNFSDLHLLDIGDFAEGKGIVTKTQRGEISVEVKAIRILTKALRPLPDAWDGLKDKETRLRRRYLDTNINEDVYQRFIRRAKFWQAHREFFKSRNFLEMNIPVLESIPGGADANPFITHMDAINQDFYLRISQELYLKRLIGGGYQKVYEIGPRFRNEGLSDEHLPEHMAMEFYWAYADWKDGMKLIKELFTFILETVYEGKKQFKIKGFDVDFSKDWVVIDFAEIMKEKFGINVHETSTEELRKILEEKHLKVDEPINVPRALDTLWKSVRVTIAGPAFLINHPKSLSPLAKANSEFDFITERFQPIIAGSELGNGWSEINNPIDQLERFREQQAFRDAGDAEAQWLDIDYVEMLEYGMPPTFGYGHSERVFWFLENVSAREGVPFPQLVHEIDETTKEIYGLKGNEKSAQKTTGSVTDNINYSIDPNVKKDFPGIFFACLEINNVDIKKSDPRLEKLKMHVLETKKTLTSEEIGEIQPIKEYRKLFKATGTDYHSKKPSPEALLKRIVNGKGVYNINTAVDAYNLAVVETRVGLGGFDRKSIDEPVILRYSKAGEKMKLLGDSEETILRNGHLVYADANKPITLDLNYRDVDETKITEKTENILLFADGAPGLDKQEVIKALEMGARYIQMFCGGTVTKINIVS